MKRLDEKLDKVYNFTVSYIESNGFPPSVREICAECNIKSTATVFSYLERLKQRGLIGKIPDKKRAISLPNSVNNFKSIPIIGTVTAGTPIFAVENLEGYCPLPPEFNLESDCFALKVNGESMIKAGIFDRDTIIVQKAETADNGEIVVALIDDSATVKRFYKRGNKIILHPENDEMEDMIFNDVMIIGKVKGLIRKF